MVMAVPRLFFPLILVIIPLSLPSLQWDVNAIVEMPHYKGMGESEP